MLLVYATLLLKLPNELVTAHKAIINGGILFSNLQDDIITWHQTQQRNREGKPLRRKTNSLLERLSSISEKNTFAKD